MQKSKKFITAFLATIMVMSTAACGGNASQNSSSQQSAGVSSATSATGEEKTGYDTHVELSWFKEGITGHEINYDGDAYGQFWQDKFNTTFDLTAATMDDSDWSQRLRIWINSGDMPDVAHWGFNYGELVDYAAQDAVYRFPDDWKERWPNVAASQECVPGAAVAEEKLGGTYTLFRTIFANHRPSKRLSYHALLYMRKDWMQACGVEIKDTYSPSELEEIATKFKEEDPGNVGSQLVPISIRTYDVPKIYPGTYFPQSINVGDGYYKDESGQFQWAPADERTLEGLKKYQNLYKEFSGHGFNTLRQEKSHIHSAQPTPDGSRLLVADLGTDRLYKFVMDAEIGLMLDEEQPYFQVRAGQGPRHFAFHPNGKWLYLVTELDCSLLVFRYQNNRLNQVGEYSLREKGDPDSSLAADIHVSPDGKFLYVSVRGPGCLQGFEIQKENGLLNPLGRFSTGGWCPRSFHISPDGRYVAVANQELGTLEVFPRENTNGQLGKLLCCVEVPHVSCVKWRNKFLR